MFFRASGIWPGSEARPAAVSAGAVNPPGELQPSVPTGVCCWRRSRSNNHQKREYTGAIAIRFLLPHAAARLKNIVTQGVVSGI